MNNEYAFTLELLKTARKNIKYALKRKYNEMEWPELREKLRQLDGAITHLKIFGSESFGVGRYLN
jgi:hypothetical protein